MNAAIESWNAPTNCLSILVCLGFAETDGIAFDQSARIAQRVPCSELHLVHVFDAEPPAARSQDLIDRLRLYVNQKAGAMESPGGITVGIHLRWGKVVREIVQLATEVHADLIVVGSGKLPHVNHAMAGSTTQGLIVLAPCPVIMASPRPKEPQKRTPTPAPPGRGVSLSGSDREARGPTRKANLERIAHELEGGAAGALAGAVVGAGAGPPGALAGALFGGFAGAMAGAALDGDSSRQAAHTRELDAEIGVVGGELGLPEIRRVPPDRHSLRATRGPGT
jgi:nucleotide-binding universal stress UspA family protein